MVKEFFFGTVTILIKKGFYLTNKFCIVFSTIIKLHIRPSDIPVNHTLLNSVTSEIGLLLSMLT